MQNEHGFVTAYQICNQSPTKDLHEVLRSFAAQLLLTSNDLAIYVFENYAEKGLEPSMAQMKKLIPELLKSTHST